MASQSVIWTLIVVVILCVVGIMLFRKVLDNLEPTLGPTLTGIINAIQIAILNFIYGKTAKLLNDYENHRTETEYENALISKTFLFKFVNSYNSLFYVAFFKQYDDNAGGCLSGSCMQELQTQLATLFVTMVTTNNVVEAITPIIMNYLNARKNRAFTEPQGDEAPREIPKSQAEDEFEKMEVDTFVDFDEMVIQYGYVTLFVVAFPLAPLLALINNFIEIRLDAHKISKFCRRPQPDGASNIGTWFDILQIISFISVITNALICVFSTDVVNDATYGNKDSKVWAFLIAEHIIIGLKLFIAYAIDDEPASMKEHLARQDYLVDVLINGKEEEPEEDPELIKLSGSGDDKSVPQGCTFDEVPAKPEPAAFAYYITPPKDAPK